MSDYVRTDYRMNLDGGIQRYPALTIQTLEHASRTTEIILENTYLYEQRYKVGARVEIRSKFFDASIQYVNIKLKYYSKLLSFSRSNPNNMPTLYYVEINSFIRNQIIRPILGHY